MTAFSLFGFLSSALGGALLRGGDRSPVTKIAVMAACRGFGFAFSLMVMLLLTRALARDDYGTLSVALALQSYLGVFSLAGARTISLREASRHPDHIEPIVGADLRLVCGSALVWWMLLFLLLVFQPGWGGQRWVYLLAASGTLAMVADLQGFFDARGQQATGALLSGAGDACALAAIGLWLVFGSQSLLALAAIFSARFVVSFAVQAWVLPLRWRQVLRGAGPWPGQMFRPAIWITLTQIAAGGLLPLNLFLTRAKMGPEAAGVMGIAVQIAGVYFTVAVLASRLALPRAARKEGLTREQMHSIVLWFAGYVISLALVAIVSLAGLVYYLLPDGYASAFLPAAILLGAMTIQTLGELPGIYLLINHCERQLLVCWMGILAIFALAFWLLPPAYGLLAAPLATLFAVFVGQGLLVVSAVRQARRTRRSDETPTAAILTVVAEP